MLGAVCCVQTCNFFNAKITYIFLITLAFEKADLLEILNMKDFDLIYSVSDISCV